MLEGGTGRSYAMLLRRHLMPTSRGSLPELLIALAGSADRWGDAPIVSQQTVFRVIGCARKRAPISRLQLL